MSNNQNTLDQNILRQILFILIIAGLGLLLIYELSFFIPAVLGSLTLYILMRKRMHYLTEVKKWNRPKAAWLLLILSFLVILLPFGILANLLTSKIVYAVEHSNQILDSLKKFSDQMKLRFGFTIADNATINEIGPFIRKIIPQILSITVNTLSIIGVLYFVLYFMLVHSRTMEDKLYEYIPLQDSNVDLIAKDIDTTVKASAIGIPLIALIQGVVGLIGYLLIGVDDPFLWFAITCITAMLPVVGAALAYVPLSIIFFAQGKNLQGFIMLIFGFGVIGLVDNLFRFILNKRLGNIHPLITVFGVIAGISMFGFIGLIFGPMLLSLFIVLLKVYSNEFFSKKRESKRAKTS
ncbi:MAG TPA: AI-2E family transporter [Chitinophagaceae bacterium]|jgi:predicted PurR-regulated permease PerM|nr:AI-2E family transporter [Chitinophagaceae bacterium]